MTNLARDKNVRPEAQEEREEKVPSKKKTDDSNQSGIGDVAQDDQKSVRRVYVRISESLSPVDRYSRYEEPLDAVLAEQDLGAVTGGGTMVRDGQTEYCGIDVELTDLSRGIEALKQVLQSRGAPKDTVLEIESEGPGAGAQVRVWD